MFDAFNLLFGEVIEVCSFWKGSANDAVPIFNASLFPVVIGVTEERAGSDLLIQEKMLGVFRAVVVGDRSTKMGRQSPQRRAQGFPAMTGRFVGDLGYCGIARDTFHGRLQHGLAATPNDKVGFPVPWL